MFRGGGSGEVWRAASLSHFWHSSFNKFLLSLSLEVLTEEDSGRAVAQEGLHLICHILGAGEC